MPVTKKLLLLYAEKQPVTKNIMELVDGLQSGLNPQPHGHFTRWSADEPKPLA
ncbi:hypothetical protein PCANC_20099 [Puccinia coronata f. sp. avenae]|uniref:Uncharacterized protein n=1 Tax=Puccinia coronata f. sp. avenae TaxID=200324 RepID=A0A2N5TZF1_9BASI|nr:hypothetical protein PCANC_20099 [Puccinia coronata f. sp. avenae]